MYKIEHGLTDFTSALNSCWKSGTFNVNIMAGKIGVLSFVDFDSGWDWLKYLVRIQKDGRIGSDFHFMTVVFRVGGQVIHCASGFDGSVKDEVSADSFFDDDYFLDTANFDLLLDKVSGGNYNLEAEKYKTGFSGEEKEGNEFLGVVFPPPTGVNKIWTYIAGKNNKITDKWHSCGPTGPVSLSNIPMKKVEITLTRNTDADCSTSLTSSITGLNGSIDIDYVHNGTPANAKYSYNVSLNHNEIDFVTPLDKAESTGAEGILTFTIYYGADIAGIDDDTNYKLPDGESNFSIVSVTLTDNVFFDSEDFGNSAAFLRRRLINLNSDPFILKAIPKVDSKLKAFPGEEVEIFFSKPWFTTSGVRITGTDFSVTGGGFDSPDAPVFTGYKYIDPDDSLKDYYDKLMNRVRLNLTGILDDDTTPEIDIVPSGLEDHDGTAFTAAEANFIADSTPPELSGFDSVPDDLEYISEPEFSFTFDRDAAPDATHIYISINDANEPGVDDSGWIPLTAENEYLYDFRMNPQPGVPVKLIRGWLKDEAGNVSFPQSFSLVFDAFPPLITSFSINTDYISSGGSVAFQIEASDNTTGISGWMITENDTRPAHDSEDWNDSTLTTITGSIAPSTAGNDGQRRLWAWVKDGAGNVSNEDNYIGDPAEAEPTSDTFFLDKTAPSISEVKITSYLRTNDRNIRIMITAQDESPGSGLSSAGFSETDDYATAVWTPWTGSGDEYGFEVSEDFGPKTIYIWVKDGAGNISSSSEVSMKIQRTRDIYLLLDYSGSMLGEKLVILENSVSALLDLTRLWESAGRLDRIGAIKFKTIIDTDNPEETMNMVRLLSAPGAANEQLIETSEDFLNGDCESTNMTAMGAALAEGLNRLQYSIPDERYENDADSTNCTDNCGAKRGIFLITDGKQNREPMVTVTGSIDPEDNHRVSINNSGGGGNSGYNGTLPVEFSQNGSGNNICYPEINTLGIGTTGDWQSTLQKIAWAGKGKHFANPEAITGVNEFFDDAVESLYLGNSPQLILSVRDDYTVKDSGTKNYYFFINRSNSSFAIKLVWQGSKRLTFELLKGNNNVSSFFKEGKGDGYHVVVIDSSTIKNLDSLEGEWVIRVGPMRRKGIKEDIPYYLSIFGEEHSLSIDLAGTSSSAYAGDPIRFVGRVFEKGIPLLNGYTMDVKITKPSNNIGDIIIAPIHEAEEHQPPFPPDFPLNEILLNQVMKIEKYKEMAVAVNVENLPMMSVRENPSLRKKQLPKGTRVAEDAKTDVPGLYQAEISISGVSKRAGDFERMIRKTILVRFSADKTRTMRDVSFIRKDSILDVIITPRDRKNRVLGPGWKDEVLIRRIYVKEYPVLKPEENKEGKYSFRFPIPSNTEAGKLQIILSICDKEILNMTFLEFMAEYFDKSNGKNA